MNSSRTTSRCRLAAAAMAATALVACGVTRAPIDERSDPAALPNLRRASQALQERIVREKEHVTGLNQQLAELLASEAQVYSEVFEAEAAYQQLRSDADDVQADVQAVDAELGQLRATLEERQAELEAARAESASLAAELAEERQAGLEARREIGFWRGAVDADGEVSTAWVQRMQAFREGHAIPEETWLQLMGELGLQALLLDPSALSPAPVAEEPPPDSLPPPEEEDAPPAGEPAAVEGEPDPAGSEPESEPAPQ